MHRLAIALVVVACGCTSFESIDRGECGNGLIEAGEDCDSSDVTCVRCAVVCSTEDACPTADYTCGVDGLCHAPGGALGPANPAGPFQINDLAITDIDRDRIGDVVGVSRTSIAVRYGEPTARLSRFDSQVTPSQISDAVFGDLDDDGATDLTISTPNGLVAYGSRFGSIAPIPVGAALVETGGDVDLRHAFHIGRQVLGAFLTDGSGNMLIAVIDFGAPVFEAPCFDRLGAIQASTFSAAAIDVYVVGANDVVVSFLTTAAPRSLCVLALHKPFLADWTFRDVTPANAGTLAHRPVLADLESDLDRCPGVVNTDAGAPALRYWDGAMTAAGCTVTPVVSPIGTALQPIPKPANTIVVGRIPLSPGFGTAAADLLVLSDGIYAYAPGAGGGFWAMYQSERRLSSAAHGDLDGDGQVDGVLIAETEDDIEVFYRRDNAVVPLFPGYVVLRLDTASRVVSTELGDYDGNGRIDIAMIEQLTDHQRLSVSYGTADLLLPPARISAFPSILSMTSVGFADSDDAAGVTDDLVVLQPPKAGTTAPIVTILNGSVLRTMTPYFDPRSGEDPDMMGPMLPITEITQLRNVMVGRFVQGDRHRDPIAVTIDSRDTPTQAPLLFRALGTATGPDSTPTPAISTTGFADCTAGLGSGLCVSDATFFAWPISGTRDTVIAFDRATPMHIVALDPGATGAIVASEVTALTTKLPAGTIIRSMHPADLDGDGTLELVVSAGPRIPSSEPSMILVCDVTDGVPRSCEDVAPAIVAATQGTERVATTCLDAAPARIAFRDSTSEAADAQDLVVVCRDTGSSLYRVHQGEAGLEISVLGRTQTKLFSVRVGDVTGDGIDDVVALEGDSGAQSLVVFGQCSSRNLAACARGAGGGS